ncbi:MAG: hypothetical protein KDA72_23230, partial [Planctomycetales bacterium]|nr:hypothetical protein [Planctomycetales bacterium]
MTYAYGGSRWLPQVPPPAQAATEGWQVLSRVGVHVLIGSPRGSRPAAARRQTISKQPSFNPD